MDEALNIKVQQAEELEARVRMWKEMMRHEGWRELLKYLESRYVELSEEDPDTLKQLSARNARMNEIKRLFQIMKHEFTMADSFRKEIVNIMNMQDELPQPFDPFSR